MPFAASTDSGYRFRELIAVIISKHRKSHHYLALIADIDDFFGFPLGPAENRGQYAKKK